MSTASSIGVEARESIWVISAALLLDNVEETRTVARVGFEPPVQQSVTNGWLSTNTHT